MSDEPRLLGTEFRATLSQHLHLVVRSFRRLVSACDQPEREDADAAALARQLQWASVHLEAALDLLGERHGTTGRPPDPLAPAESSDPPLVLDFSEGLRGHTQSITIPELLGFIASLRKSGTLVVHGSDENFLIELKDGAVVYAQGDNAPAGLLLGEILVAQGALDSERLLEYLDGHPERMGVLGNSLLEAGLITEESLRIALSFQVQHLFHRLFVQEDAWFQFEEGVHRIDSEDIRLNVQKLLLESARIRDEAPGEDPG